jgi:isopentenyl diphosphate isomerase/L-lactate dehydrogenase-like FMN-dependent dehydrogenase
MEKIAGAAKGSLWFQLYPRQQMDASREILDKAQEAGSRAVVITLDQQSPFYERQMHNRHLAPIRRTSARASAVEAANRYSIMDTRLWYNWRFLDEIRPFLKVPLLVKGVLTAEDAKLCVDNGINGLVVSNHGGRALDYSPSTLEVLPEIVEAVAGRIPVLVDSGFRRGSDIFKALALGAQAVCLGRVPRWGLAAYGAPGVQRVLEILQKELVLTMARAGRPTLGSISRSAVHTDFA